MLQFRLSGNVSRIHIAAGQNMAQIGPVQVLHQVLIIGQYISKPMALGRHQQRTGPIVPTQQVAIVFFQSKQPVHSGAQLADTGFSYTLSLINGKYKMTILYTLMCFEVVRFNEMKKYIGGISYKTLSATLKELEADGLVHREEYPQIPPKVEYSLTKRGKSLIPILDQMCDWGEQNRL